MKRSILISTPALAAALLVSPAAAQKLHINPRWHECSFQLDASLTQSAFRQFSQEAGLVTFFRPLSDARPMGRGNFEVSLLQWETGIDAADPAWNDTFVHPDSTHWLFEGSRLAFPGLTGRAGIGEKTDIGVYITKSPGGNYGFYGAQLQRALVGGASSQWAASARVSFVSMYGPEDLSYGVYGAELVTSRTITLRKWASVSPYAGLSGYLGRAQEKSTVVSLNDENVLGGRATLGAAFQVSAARLGVEYAAGRVGSFSMKVGVGF